MRQLVEEVLCTWPGKWIDGSDPASPHEATLLSLAIEKAQSLLQWHPVWDFEQTVQQTVVWYQQRHQQKAGNLLEFTAAQIDQYVQAARSKRLRWAE